MVAVPSVSACADMNFGLEDEGKISDLLKHCGEYYLKTFLLVAGTLLFSFIHSEITQGTQYFIFLMFDVSFLLTSGEEMSAFRASCATDTVGNTL